MASCVNDSSMASIHFDKSRDGFRLSFYCHQAIKRSIWLGKVRKAAAVYACRQVEDLVGSRKIAAPPSDEALKWVSNVSERIRENLVRYQLVEKTRPDTLHKYLDDYLKHKIDVKARTKGKLELAAAHLKEYFDDIPMRAFTEGDADRYSMKLRTTKASATAARELKRCRQLFNAAIKDRIITTNPFAGISVASQRNDANKVEIDKATVLKVMKHLDCEEMRAALALARFCGLRVPSEIQVLTWEDINFDKPSLTIRSPKLEKTRRPVRECPIFKDALPYIKKLDRSKPLPFVKYPTSANRMYRKNLLAAIKKAGLKPWPRLWHNLRLSCRNDLAKLFPPHVCDIWIGHSAEEAKESYLIVTDADWKKARG